MSIKPGRTQMENKEKIIVKNEWNGFVENESDSGSISENGWQFLIRVHPHPKSVFGK